MGYYTDNQKYYIIDGTELVNVEDLNYNLQRVDDRLKPLVEYQETDVNSIYDSSLPKSTGFKWWKKTTNSIWSWYNDGVQQDTNSRVDSWLVDGIVFEPGYGSMNLYDDRVAYTKTDNFVRLRGKLVLNNQSSEFPSNTAVDFMTIPTEYMPPLAQYFFVYGGNGSGNVQCFRIYVPAKDSGDKRLEYCKYGAANSTNSGERYISLNDVTYSL